MSTSNSIIALLVSLGFAAGFWLGQRVGARKERKSSNLEFCRRLVDKADELEVHLIRHGEHGRARGVARLRLIIQEEQEAIAVERRGGKT